MKNRLRRLLLMLTSAKYFSHFQYSCIILLSYSSLLLPCQRGEFGNCPGREHPKQGILTGHPDSPLTLAESYLTNNAFITNSLK